MKAERARTYRNLNRSGYLPVAVLCLSALVMLSLHLPSRAVAQINPADYEIASIRFEGNESFSNNELIQQIQTRETPGFINKFLHNSISERLGRKSEFLDERMLAEDLDRLRQFYKDHGFQDVKIDSLLLFSEPERIVDVSIRVDEGYRSVIDTLVYKGIVGVPPAVLEEIMSDSKIAVGDPFNKNLIEEDVRHVLQVLKNNGHGQAAFARQNSSITYYTSTRNFSVVLQFELGKFHRFGEITVQQELDPIREDIREEDILRQLDYATGEDYSLDKIKTSERNLNRIGIFDRAWIETEFPDAANPESIHVKTHVKIRPRDKHELAPEVLFGSDDNNNFTLGTGIGYTNRNFLSGARTFTTHLRFRTRNFRDFPDVFNANNNAIANADLTFEIIQPYIFSNKIRGSWSLSAIVDKQTFYINRILQNKFGFVSRFAEFTTGYLDWTTQLVSLEKKSSIVIDSTNLEVLRGLRDLELQDSLQQFNSILSFTIQRDMTDDIFSPSRGFFHSLTVEESGLLPLILQRWRPDLPFTQFYRTSFLLRWYLDLTGSRRFSILALKLKGGYEGKYGMSYSDSTRIIPQTHRFYAGGGGSVRGWRSRDLGIGGNPQLGGNVLAEGSLELRTNVLQSLRDDFWDKLWTVLFIDVGNVWAEARNLQVRTTAIAAGFGIRYDTFFGPFRIDYGIQIHDPRGSVSGKNWVTQRKFWSETLRLGVLHFGIGHAF